MNSKDKTIDNTEKTRNSGTITDVIIGISDGLTVPFALAAGLSAIASSAHFVFVAGMIAVVVGAIVMGFGGYFTIKSEGKPHTHEQEPLHENDTKQFYSNLGLPEEAQQQATVEVIRDKEEWNKVMKQYEAQPNAGAAGSGLTIALSYVIGGLVPLLPYLFFSAAPQALYYSVSISLIALFQFGLLKGKATGENPWLAAFRETIIGALAAGGAYFVAGLFKR